MNSAFARWRANFYAGLAIVLPAIISVAIFEWLFGTVANVTDPLLFFLPKSWTHRVGGPMYWWWSVFALGLAVAMISVIGRMARHYIGKKLILTVDMAMLRVPVLNKIYGAIKQVNQALTSSNKTSFKQVVLVSFPTQGIYSVGFITGSQPLEIEKKLNETLVTVFLPTTPNPTGGFVLLVPEHQITRLEMSVADGVKFILSLGSVAPEYIPGRVQPVVLNAAAARAAGALPLPLEG